MDVTLYGLLINKIKSVVNDIYEIRKIYNEVVTMSEQVTTDKDTVNTYKTSVENTVVEAMSSIEEYGAVQVTDTKPTNENVDVWIDDTNTEEYSLPEIKDSEINGADTWSSQKINTELQKLQEQINTLMASVATDSEADTYLDI